MKKDGRAEGPEGLSVTPNAAPLPLGGGECEFQRLGFSQVLEIPREGVLLQICRPSRTPSPTKSEV